MKIISTVKKNPLAYAVAFVLGLLAPKVVNKLKG